MRAVGPVWLFLGCWFSSALSGLVVGPGRPWLGCWSNLPTNNTARRSNHVVLQWPGCASPLRIGCNCHCKRPMSRIQRSSPRGLASVYRNDPIYTWRTPSGLCSRRPEAEGTQEELSQASRSNDFFFVAQIMGRHRDAVLNGFTMASVVTTYLRAQTETLCSSWPASRR